MSYEYYKNEVFHHEWLLTNQNGSYALGFGNMVNERKYNGLLIVENKKSRNHLVYSQEENIDTGYESFYLDTNSYLDCLNPKGYQHIIKTWLRPYPSILYSSKQFSKKISILKEIKMHENKNITLVKFKNLSNEFYNFSIRPKYTLRNHHDINKPGYWKDNESGIDVFDKSCFVRNKTNGIGVYTYITSGNITRDEIIYNNNYYTIEAARGYDAVEDLLSPFLITFGLESDQFSYILYSDEKIENPDKIINEIENRYPRNLLPVDHILKQKTISVDNILFSDRNIFTKKQYTKLLELSLKDFYVKNDIVAGYPWFYCWGRDTFISIKSFTFLKNYKEKIYKIFESYGDLIYEGIIPNMILGQKSENNYDTIDASLWFVIRAWELIDSFNNQKKKNRIFEYMAKIILNYLFGENNFFMINEYKLLTIKTEQMGLTWMDARVYNRAVTPRIGMCIEINCLWYNALKSFIEFSKKINKDTEELTVDEFGTTLSYIKKIAQTVKQNMEMFIKDEKLIDRIYEDEQIDEIRPNAIIGLSLPFKIFKRKIVENTFSYTKRELLTPYGLRSLSRYDNKFKRKYLGDQTMRDMSYHQGTVWTWLLLPYAHVFCWLYKEKYSNKKKEFIKELESIIINFRSDFLKGHISSIAEIWDGIDPNTPKGSPAQAWSVAAIYEIEKIIESM